MKKQKLEREQEHERTSNGNFLASAIWHDHGVEFSNPYDLRLLSVATGKPTPTRQKKGCDAWTCAYMPSSTCSTCTGMNTPPNACKFRRLSRDIFTTWLIHCHHYVTQNNLPTARTGLLLGLQKVVLRWNPQVGKFEQWYPHTVESESHLEKDYRSRALGFLMDLVPPTYDHVPTHLLPTHLKALSKRHDIEPLVLLLTFSPNKRDHTVSRETKEHMHLNIAEKLSGTNLFVYEVLHKHPNTNQHVFCLCVTDVPPLRMKNPYLNILFHNPLSKLNVVSAAIHTDIVWLFRSVDNPSGVWIVPDVLEVQFGKG